MQELERMISIYHTGFIVCLVLACVFFVLSVVLFFKFDIRRIIDMRTGRGAKKTIQKMEEINARTGKLRQEMVSHTPSELRPEDRIAYPATAPNLQVQAEVKAGAPAEAASTPVVTAATATPDATPMSAAASVPVVTTAGANGVAAGSAETEQLASEGAAQTTVLYETGETTVLSQNLPKSEDKPAIALPGMFEIVKETMWLHTDVVL